MPSLASQLKKRLNSASRVGLLAVGSDLRADDAAGLLVAQALQKAMPRSRKFRAFDGGTAPENLTGEIRKFAPAHLLIVDAADCGLKPGAVKIIPTEMITGASFSTHKMPPNVLVEFIRQTMQCEVTIVAIQPRTLEFAQPPTKTILAAVQRVAQAVRAALAE